MRECVQGIVCLQVVCEQGVCVMDCVEGVSVCEGVCTQGGVYEGLCCACEGV